jgi:hypothetical protein
MKTGAFVFINLLSNVLITEQLSVDRFVQNQAILNELGLIFLRGLYSS